MSIDRKEIERILEALETKSTGTYKSSNRYGTAQHYNTTLSEYYLGQSEAFDHAAALLRQVLHG